MSPEYKTIRNTDTVFIDKDLKNTEYFKKSGERFEILRESQKG